jgi:hypothetical protein
MIQLPPAISVKAKEEKGQEAAVYLQNITNKQARQGWEFYRVDTVGVVTQPGCLASLLGAKETYVNYYVATFRREEQNAP